MQGPAGPLVTTLPAGSTLTGMYSWAGVSAPSGYHPVYPLSFQFPLKTGPTINVIAVGGASTAACPGTAAAPTATSGNLCVYQTRNDGSLAFNVIPSSADTRFGVALYFPIAASTSYEYEGTWAVTGD